MQSYPRFRIWPKRLIFLIYGIIVALIAMRLKTSVQIGAIAVFAPIIIAELLLQALSKSHFSRFSDELMSLLQSNDDDRLLPFYQSQRFLRFAAPPYQMLDKLGLIYGHIDDFQSAASAYQDALEEAPGKKQVEIAIKLADSLRKAKRLDEAERFYREIIAVTTKHPESYQQLARLIIAREPKSDEALELLKKAEENAHHDDKGIALRCEYIQLLLEHQKLDHAKEIFAKVEHLDTDDETVKEVVTHAKSAIEIAENA